MPNLTFFLFFSAHHNLIIYKWSKDDLDDLDEED